MNREKHHEDSSTPFEQYHSFARTKRQYHEAPREFESAYEATQLFIRRGFAELSVSSRGVELVVEW